MNDNAKNEALATFTFVGLLALALILAFSMTGCGSNIPIGEAPSCVDLVTDECVPEVIEEFCTSGTDCTGAYQSGYANGFAAGVASVVPDECPVCEVCETCDGCDGCEACEACDPNAGYEAGYEDGADSVVCEDDEDSDDGCKDNGHHYGNDKPDCHKHGKGRK